jgi:hypothetical protein
LVAISPRNSTVGEFLIAQNVDLADLGLGSFADLEHHIDAVLVLLDDFRLDSGGEAALALVQFDDARNVGAHLGAGKDLARGRGGFREDLVILDPLVAFQDRRG